MKYAFYFYPYFRVLALSKEEWKLLRSEQPRTLKVDERIRNLRNGGKVTLAKNQMEQLK